MGRDKLKLKEKPLVREFKSLKKWIAKVTERPFQLCILGWVLFPAMYFLLGVFTENLGIPMDFAIAFAAPSGLIGFCCWLVSLFMGIKSLSQGRSVGLSILTIVGAFIPLAFIALVFISMALSLPGKNTNEKETGTLLAHVEFFDPKQLPAKVLCDEAYFEKTGNVILLLSDYQKSYSRLVEYNVQKREFGKTIFECDDSKWVYEMAMDDGVVVFSLLVKGSVFHQELYYFQLNDKKVIPVHEKPINESNDIFSAKVAIENGFITWIEHDFKKEESAIMYFSIKNGSKKIVDSTPFTKSRIRVSHFFQDSNGSFLVYDKQAITGSNTIVVYDLNQEKMTGTFPAFPETVLHYSGSYDSQKNLLVLYAQAGNEDFIYSFSLTTGEQKKLVGFSKESNLYGDFIDVSDDEFFYVVQKNVSGKISDHYHAEWYNLKDFSMKSIKRCFSLFQVKQHLFLLKFDDAKVINKIHLEIYKR